IYQRDQQPVAGRRRARGTAAHPAALSRGPPVSDGGAMTALPFLPYGRQVIDDADIAAVVEGLKSPFLTQGPLVERFEAALAAEAGARHAVACSNGTTALHLAAAVLDLQPGDAVIVPAITFLATANAARYVGAEVVFADVDPATGLMRVADA